MRHMLGNLSPNYFERTKRAMMLRASRQGTDLTVSGTPPLSLPNSLGKPLKAWSVDLLPYQEGTGDPAPDNVRPIHGTDKVTVWTAGKNLLNPNVSAWTDSAVYKGFKFSDTPITATLSISNKDTSVDIGNAYLGLTGINDQTNVRWLVQGGVASTTSLTQTDKCYVSIYPKTEYAFNQLFARYNIQLEFGSTPTSYTPYIAPSSSVITLPSTIYSGQVYTGGAVSRMAKVVLDGTQTGILPNWRSTETSVGVLYPYSVIPNKVSESDTIPPNILADVLPTITYRVAYNGTSDIGISAVTGAGMWGVCIRLPDITLTTSALVNQYLAEHPITVIYEVATPTSLTISTPTIPTPKGNATTWATAEDGTVDGMEVTYIGKA